MVGIKPVTRVWIWIIEFCSQVRVTDLHDLAMCWRTPPQQVHILEIVRPRLANGLEIKYKLKSRYHLRLQSANKAFV